MNQVQDRRCLMWPIMPLVTPYSAARSIGRSPATILSLILATCTSVSFARAFRSPFVARLMMAENSGPLGCLSRPFAFASRMLSLFVPRNKCVGFTHRGTSQ